MGFNEYIKFCDKKFRKIKANERLILYVPILGTIFWIAYGITIPNLFFPIDYYFSKKRKK